VRFTSVILTLLSVAMGAQAADYLVYAGTYTRGDSRGIYVFRFNPANGKLSGPTLAAETLNPSFLAEHPNHRFLYAVNEGGNGGNQVSAFSIDAASGKLTPLNAVSSQGSGPCHLAIDATGKWLTVANYNNGTMAVLGINPDGTLAEAKHVERHEGSSVNPQRQKGPHAHCVLFSPDNRFLFLADLGLDKIFVYKFDAATGALTPNDPPSASVTPGAGVRHLAFHPNGRILYSINEMGNTVTAFHYDPAKGALQAFQDETTLPEGFKGNSSTAEVAVNRAGTRVYGSNRGNDTIALFAIDPRRETLSPMDHTSTLGKTPRHFTLDPTGKFLLVANQDSSDISVFKVHPSSGQLTPNGPPVKGAAFPVCLLFYTAK
jgi:6-phosphogluconolactonase